MKEIISKLRKYEIKIRKAVNSHKHGSFNSLFKGNGLEFSDHRLYQYGDDVRTIDWITTAKGHGTYVKMFKEEKEQTVFFLVDVSESQKLGSIGENKIDTAKEICGVLSLSATKEGSDIGLYCFSDQKELYVKPAGGMKHCIATIIRLFRLENTSNKTNLNEAFNFILNHIKKKSVVILISDFLDSNYEEKIKAIANKHDLVLIHLYDKREIKFPKLGIVPVIDQETKKAVWINTSSKVFRKELKNIFEENRLKLETLCKSYNANYLDIESGTDFTDQLVKLFKYR